MSIADGYVSLEYVANSVILERNEDDRWYEKILQLVIRGFLELNMNDVYPNIKTTEIFVDNNNVAKFPQDYISYIAISIENNGRLVPLVYNKNINLTTEESCGDVSGGAITNTNEAFDGGGSQYTQGGGFSHAYYRVDEDNKQIIFLKDKVRGLKIILDYKATGLSGSTVVPRDMVTPLQAYVDWRLDKRDKQKNLGEVENSRLEWIRERSKMYARRHSFSKSEYLSLRYKNTHRGLK